MQDGVVEALFEGYFCDGADIGNAEVLTRLGVEGGLESEDIAAMLASDAGLKEVTAADRMARNAGIQGVPSFALQGHVLFSGAVPADEMSQAFRRAWEILKNRAGNASRRYSPPPSSGEVGGGGRPQACPLISGRSEFFGTERSSSPPSLPRMTGEEEEAVAPTRRHGRRRHRPLHRHDIVRRPAPAGVVRDGEVAAPPRWCGW